MYLPADFTIKKFEEEIEMNKVVKNCGFHHIALSASDFEKSLKFYTEGLGFEVYRSWVAGSGKKIALLDMGNGNCIELFSDGEKAEYPAEPAGSYFHLALKTDDAKDAYEKAIAYGAPSHKAPDTYALPAQPPINAIIAFVKGPDGELVEFFQELD